MDFKKHITFFSALILSILALPYIADARTGIVNASLLNVREYQDVYSSSLSKLSKGDEVEILNFENDWYMIKLSDGTEGFAKAEYITPNPVYYGKINTASAFVYSSVDEYSPVLSSLSQGEVVELLAYDGVWYKIKTPFSQTGFVLAQNIISTEESASLPIDDGNTYGYVVSPAADLHSDLGEYSPVATVLMKDTRIRLLAYDGVWYKASTADGITGFVNVGHIAHSVDGIPMEVVPNISTGYIDASALNIRSSTGVGHDILTTLPKGSAVTLLAYDGHWYKLQLENGEIGYASADYISLTPVNSYTPSVANTALPQDTQVIDSYREPTEDEIALGEEIIESAYEYLGVPYRYSASGPDSFDCSGFTMYVMALNDISLPHQSGRQYTYGFPVSVDNLIAGDLVFFNSASNQGVAHVGIYISDGKFIHASSGSAYSVTISSLYDDYYTRHYLGARRVL